MFCEQCYSSPASVLMASAGNPAIFRGGCGSFLFAEKAVFGGCRRMDMNSMKLVIPLCFVHEKNTPNDAVTPQRQSQLTPKMKANAVPRLLSSLV